MATHRAATVSHLLRARRVFRYVIRATRRSVLLSTRQRAHRPRRLVSTLRTAHAACLVVRLIGQLRSGRRQRLPPVTAALVTTLLAIHLVRGPAGAWLPPSLRLPAAAVCIRPAATLAARRLATRRVLGSVVAHADVAHVLYNVAATAVWLPPVETATGLAGTTALLAALTAIAHVMTVLLAAAVAAVGVAPASGSTCIVGASGVLFGLRVLGGSAALSTRPGRRRAVAGTRLVGGRDVAPGLPAVRVPVWAAPMVEAALLSAVHPRASAVGHAAGIVAGWLVLVGVLGCRGLIEAASHWLDGVRRRGVTALRVVSEEGESVGSSVGERLGDSAARESTWEDMAGEHVTPPTTEESGGTGGLRYRRPHAVVDD